MKYQILFFGGKKQAIGHNFHGISDPVFWGKSEKYHQFVVCLISLESGKCELHSFNKFVELFIA